MKIPLIIVAFSSLLIILAYSTTNYKGYTSVHKCSDNCYEAELKNIGTLADRLQAETLSLSTQTTIDMGKDLYSNNCVACHGTSAQGGIGPYLAGKSDIVSLLQAYKRKETRGTQSVIMWANAQQLSTTDMENLAEYISTLNK
jgi:cytochrome c553